MLKKLKSLVASSPLLQVASFNSLNIAVKFLTSLAVSKLIALLLGPSGLTFIGNLRNALSIFQNFATGGLTKAIIKYTGETKNDHVAFQSFISTLFWALIFLSLVIFVFVFGFSKTLSNFVFGETSFAYVFKWTAVLLPVYGLNAFLLAILNGLSQFNKVIRINLFTHILNLLVFSYCIYVFGLSGALMAVVIVPSASFILTLLLSSQQFNFFKVDWKIFSVNQLKNFGQYAFMTLISAISFPLVFLGIRQLLSNQIGIDEAGYWEANFRLSTFYLIFMQSLLNLYVLPKLVEAQSEKSFKSVVYNFYKQVIPLFSIGLLLVFLLRKYLVLLVFSEEFLPVTSLLGWQIIGDFFRILSLVMVYQFHAKKMLWHYIITDLFLALGLYFSAIQLIDIYGLQGVVIGHALTYVLYFILIGFIFRRTFFISKL